MARSASDKAYKKTKRQISKEYNDSFERILKENRKYFKRVNDIQTGKIPPPSGLKTERQIEAWKQGYLRRYTRKMGTVEKMIADFESAGGKCRKSVTRLMRQTFGIENKSLLDAIDKDGIIKPRTAKQIDMLLDKRSTSFDRAAFKNLENATAARKRLRREFAQGILNGDDDKAMIRRIQNVANMAESDAMRILETERTRVQGIAAQETAEEIARETGKHLQKRWICTFRNSRDSHIALHGKEVELDDDFAPNLKYPGDERAPAHEVINCRCRMEVFEVGG